MKNLIALPLLCLCFSLSAQTTEKKTFAPVDIYHGVIITPGISSDGSGAGYFLDIHMRKRLWLFTDYSMLVTDWQGTTTRNSFRLDLFTSYKFAFRLNKETSRFTYYPYIGFSIVPAYFYYQKNGYEGDTFFGFNPLANVIGGFEAKMRIGPKMNLGLGTSFDVNRGLLFHLKFGWNRAYKR